jgi:hypothetical protein
VTIEPGAEGTTGVVMAPGSGCITPLWLCASKWFPREAGADAATCLCGVGLLSSSTQSTSRCAQSSGMLVRSVESTAAKAETLVTAAENAKAYEIDVCAFMSSFLQVFVPARR